MRESVLYIRGQFPFGFEAGVSDDVVRDAKIILDLPVDDLNAIRTDLEQFPGFLDRNKLRELLLHRVPDVTNRKGLARFITTFGERVHRTGESIDTLVRQIEEWMKEKAEEAQIIQQDQIAELRRRLKVLLAPLPCLVRQAKAEKLSTATGQPLESVEIICDVRPVFDKNRNTIDGMIPFTLLRVVYKGADGLPVAVETILSEKDVHSLADAAQKAQQKLKRIHELLLEKGIEVPTTKLTMPERDDAK